MPLTSTVIWGNKKNNSYTKDGTSGLKDRNTVY